MTTDQHHRRSRWRVLHAYLVLPHATPILVVLASTAIIAIVVNDGLPATGVFASILLAMLGGQITIGAVNELIDAPTDARVKPTKPIPAGLVSRRGATVLAIAAFLAMLVFAALPGWESLLLCTVGTVTGIAYSVWFKRTLLAWVPYLVALPLLPIWVVAAIDRFDARLLMLYPLGVFAVVGVYLAQSLPDIAADRAAGIDNLTVRLGESLSLRLSIGSQLIAAIVAIAAATRWGDISIMLATGAIVATIALTALALSYVAPRRAVRACFPCVAVSTALLGIGWVIGVT